LARRSPRSSCRTSGCGEALLARCRAEHLEPPGRIDRILGAARATAAERFCQTTLARLRPAAIGELERLIVGEDGGVGQGRGRGLAELKADPGQVSLETLFAELGKLERIRTLGLPADLFARASEKLVAAWRSRAATEYPSDLRDRPRPVRLTLLACLCWMRAWEPTDALVELLIALVHKINARAERRVEGELLSDLKRVRGKEGLLFRIAEASTAQPDGTVRQVIFPVASEQTLNELVREARANQAAFKTQVRKVCAPPTPATTGGCCPGCSTRWSFAPTTAPTGR
jgi:hypothetical protein